jgi:hypothetical protein
MTHSPRRAAGQNASSRPPYVLFRSRLCCAVKHQLPGDIRPPVPGDIAGRMEGASADGRMRMVRMDSIKGAQELARLLAEHDGTAPESVRRAPLRDSSAAPVFHWLGIEPPREPLDAEGVVGRRRLRSYLSRLRWG